MMIPSSCIRTTAADHSITGDQWGQNLPNGGCACCPGQTRRSPVDRARGEPRLQVCTGEAASGLERTHQTVDNALET